jgi:hypothetical protein
VHVHPMRDCQSVGEAMKSAFATVDELFRSTDAAKVSATSSLPIYSTCLFSVPSTARHTNVNTHPCTHMHLYTHVSIYTHPYTHLYLHTLIYLHTCIHTYIHSCMHAQGCGCGCGGGGGGCVLQACPCVGTCVVCLIIDNGRAAIAHAGDCRAVSLKQDGMHLVFFR